MVTILHNFIVVKCKESYKVFLFINKYVMVEIKMMSVRFIYWIKLRVNLILKRKIKIKFNNKIYLEKLSIS